MTFDDRGDLVETAFFDAVGKRAVDSEGCTRITYKYDARGNRTETLYLGTDGRPVPTKDGYSRMTNEYERDNETSRTYFGTNGNPIAIAVEEGHSYARRSQRYDQNGNQVYEAYFDADRGIVPPSVEFG